MSENIPAGWKLVPIDATKAMEAAAVSRVRPYHDTDWRQHMPKDLFRLAWPALLDAAPPPPTHISVVTWLPIERADKTITDVQEFSEVGMTIKTSDRYWVRDDDGRVYEAAWSEGNNGRDYWWDFEGESPVDPVEFMPHPLDPRFAAISASEVEG